MTGSSVVPSTTPRVSTSKLTILVRTLKPLADGAGGIPIVGPEVKVLLELARAIAAKEIDEAIEAENNLAIMVGEITVTIVHHLSSIHDEEIESLAKTDLEEVTKAVQEIKDYIYDMRKKCEEGPPHKWLHRCMELWNNRHALEQVERLIKNLTSSFKAFNNLCTSYVAQFKASLRMDVTIMRMYVDIQHMKEYITEMHSAQDKLSTMMTKYYNTVTTLRAPADGTHSTMTLESAETQKTILSAETSHRDGTSSPETYISDTVEKGSVVAEAAGAKSITILRGTKRARSPMPPFVKSSSLSGDDPTVSLSSLKRSKLLPSPPATPGKDSGMKGGKISSGSDVVNT
ncbi:hypothetical protein EW145_g7223 [Phellinidium pouzarii]|uniref:Uncharacterized protein n=1 Tax=Phellinidium pouzarii TaxID=167371 RepID=A0A4S4KND3_9AGAM|nr:hypothetical protein EW145_g7223 [Phellinidium pouzarii]